MDKIILFFLENKLVTFLLLAILIIWGIVSAPFGWDKGFLPDAAVSVDAIPDIGENQQIVYTEWPGRSPRDIEDQISYPLTTSLLGMPGVKTIRSNSIFGLSSIYIIFENDIEFYWSRSRILEKLNSLPAGTLPEDVSPALGPDATALGQIFWYTLEGRDEKNRPNGGWDPVELRTLQDYHVKYALTSAQGVAEVASIGGFIKEYQIDIDPNAMRMYGVSSTDIMHAVKKSNLDIGARSIEYNRAEYLVRSLGYIQNLSDLENSVVRVIKNVPVRLKDVAKIQFGPAARRGGLDKGGAEAVGGVVVARFGANPAQVVKNIKQKIAEIAPGLPSRTLPDGTVSKVTIIPFYDRSGLIKETLGTLEVALSLEMLIAIIVVIILVVNLRASFLISGLLPVGVLMTFIIMYQSGTDANIVALSGIAISIGVMVDVGIVFTENIVRHLEHPENKNAKSKKLLYLIHTATVEMAPAVITALLTTIVSFLPVFALQAAEGKLFKPLAFTKTFAMITALTIGLIFIPAAAYFLFSIKIDRTKLKRLFNLSLVIPAAIFFISDCFLMGFAMILIVANNLLINRWKWNNQRRVNIIDFGIILIAAIYLLTKLWLPLGAGNSIIVNFIFVVVIIGMVLGFFMSVIRYYDLILSWCLDNKFKFLAVPVLIIFLGLLIWRGVDNTFSFAPGFVRSSYSWQTLNRIFPGIGREFMPALDEGSFLLMPTTMPHSGVEENIEIIRILDKQIESIPEIENVVGKWGRVNSAIDPAPVSMFENVINYKPEYILNEKGHRQRYKQNSEGAFILRDGTTYNPEEDEFKNITSEKLIPDADGAYFRQWRKHIRSSDDIWNEIAAQTQIPGLTSAPKLQPIQTRLIMLQTGMRAPMGIKVFGPDIETIENFAMQLEEQIKNVPGVKPQSVFADRIVGKPYLEIHPDRAALSRFGLTIEDLQRQISGTIGGMKLTNTVEGRERFPVRVRYAREFRDNPEELKNILIQTSDKSLVPLKQMARIHYTRGPQMIKSENSFLVGYVIFDKTDDIAETDVVEYAGQYLHNKIDTGELQVPQGVSYVFTGNYENQVRASQRLLLIVPVALIVIFLIIYFQFRSVIMSGLIFSGIIVALSGGFLLIWLYGQNWFMNFVIAGIPVREMFQIHTINLSVAVWVGFIALFGIATDDGVLISTYLKQLFTANKPENADEVKSLVMKAGQKRIRPAMMTTATTIIALLPVLSSTGKGSDIMVPMALPIVGGMLIASMTVFIVPVLFSLWQEIKIKSMNIK